MAGMRLQCKVEPPLLQPFFRDVAIKLFCKYYLTYSLFLIQLDASGVKVKRSAETNERIDGQDHLVRVPYFGRRNHKK